MTDDNGCNENEDGTRDGGPAVESERAQDHEIESGRGPARGHAPGSESVVPSSEDTSSASAESETTGPKPSVPDSSAVSQGAPSSKLAAGEVSPPPPLHRPTPKGVPPRTRRTHRAPVESREESIADETTSDFLDFTHTAVSVINAEMIQVEQSIAIGAAPNFILVGTPQPVPAELQALELMREPQADAVAETQPEPEAEPQPKAGAEAVSVAAAVAFAVAQTGQAAEERSAGTQFEVQAALSDVEQTQAQVSAAPEPFLEATSNALMDSADEPLTESEMLLEQIFAEEAEHTTSYVVTAPEISNPADSSQVAKQPQETMQVQTSDEGSLPIADAMHSASSVEQMPAEEPAAVIAAEAAAEAEAQPAPEAEAEPVSEAEAESQFVAGGESPEAIALDAREKVENADLEVERELSADAAVEIVPEAGHLHAAATARVEPSAPPAVDSASEPVTEPVSEPASAAPTQAGVVAEPVVPAPMVQPKRPSAPPPLAPLERRTPPRAPARSPSQVPPQSPARPLPPRAPYNPRTDIFALIMVALIMIFQNCSDAKFSAPHDPDTDTNVAFNPATVEPFACKTFSVIAPDPSGRLDIPARDSAGTCYVLKILNSANFAPSSSNPYQDQEVLSRNHDSDASDPLQTRHPYVLGSAVVNLFMEGARSIELTGSNSGGTSITVDNFLLVGLGPSASLSDPSYYAAYGTSDSTIELNGKTDSVEFRNQAVPLTPFASSGTSTVAALALEGEIEIKKDYSLDIRALDCGSIGELSDVYLLFQ